jgi:hypothetical protein
MVVALCWRAGTGVSVKISLPIIFLALSINSDHAAAQESSIDSCPDLKVEIIGVEEEAGREVGIVRITNFGEVPRKFDLAGVDPTRRFPLLDRNSYTLYTCGVSSLRWMGALLTGAFMPPNGRLAVERGQAVLVAANFAKAYRSPGDAGYAAYIEVFTRDPVCSVSSDQVRIADMPPYNDLAWGKR